MAIESFRVCALFVILFCCGTVNGIGICKWKDDKHKDAADDIQHLFGKVYTAKPIHDVDKKYEYTIGICASAANDTLVKKNPSYSTAGGLQKKTIGTKTTYYVLGRTDVATVMRARSFVLLTYEGGDAYHHPCSSAERRTMVMITCGSGHKDALMINEKAQSANDTGCFYLFEVEDSSVCPKDDKHLSPGSVFLIIFFSVGGTYLLGGFLYQRCVVKAQGLEQIPNYGFWKKIGGLSADGCNLVCRCGERMEEREYSSLDSPSHSSSGAVAERDDDLLDM